MSTTEPPRAIEPGADVAPQRSGGTAVGDEHRALPARSDGALLDDAGMIWPTRYPANGLSDKAAILFDGRITTYGELDDTASSFVALMQRLHVDAGERVAYLGKNSDMYFNAVFGSLRAGVALVPLNWRCTVNELRSILEDASPKIIICDEDLVGVARGAAAPATAMLVITGKGGLQEMLAAERPASWTEPSADAAAMLIYTSGTTGAPKGVVVTNRMLAIARHVERISVEYDDWRADDILLSPMPNFHMGALCWMLGGISRGLTCVLTADATPDSILSLCRDYQVTRTFVVPTVIRGMLELMRAQGVSLPHLREIHYGASPMDVALLALSLAEIGCRFVHHYGMTEITGTATRLGPRDHDLTRPHLLGSVGKPQPGLSIEIRRRDLSLAECGEAGEIWIRSATLTPGYWHQPEATEEAIRHGWYRTGDGGLLDKEGFLFLTDRIKDMVVSGGENIYPIEVEAALRTHPAILDVAVFGMPDARWGETVVAAVEFRAEMNATAKELREHTRALIAGYKVPKRFILDTVLPRTATGKVRRAAARSSALQALS